MTLSETRKIRDSVREPLDEMKKTQGAQDLSDPEA
jgi:hypothetical protein